MNDLEKFNTIKANKLCYNCFQGDYFTSKCESKNTCFKNDCSAKHHTTLHKYFTSNQRNRNNKGRKKIQNKTQTSKGKRTKFSHLQA